MSYTLNAHINKGSEVFLILYVQVSDRRKFYLREDKSTLVKVP